MPRPKRDVRAPARFAEGEDPPPPKRQRTTVVPGAAAATESGSVGAALTSSSSSSSSGMSGQGRDRGLGSRPTGGEFIVNSDADIANCNDVNNYQGTKTGTDKPDSQPVGLTVSWPSQAGLPSAVPSYKKGNSLGLAIPSATKQKIWDGEYVDFSQLLHGNTVQLLTSQQQSEMVFAINAGGNMVLRPAVQSKEKIDTLDKWVSAFHVFMAIFLEKHPARVAELLQYAETIRLAAAQFPGPSWRAYDEQFRLRKAADPSSSWGEMDMELWVTVAAAASIRSSNPNNTAGSGTGIGNTIQQFGRNNNNDRGVCYAFNRVRGCHYSHCRYAHKCSVCFRAGHSASVCRSGSQGNRQPAAAASFAGDRSHSATRRAFGRRVPGLQDGGKQTPKAQHVPQASLLAAAAKGKPANFRASNAY